MNKVNLLRALVLVGLVICSNTSAEVLLEAETSWDGGRFSYPEGKPRISSVRLDLEPGVEAAFHCHPVPTMGYVLKGTVEVETSAGDKTVLHPGESVVEVMRTVHRGRAVEGPASIVVFYAGTSSLPTTVTPEEDPNNQYCNP